MKIGANTGCFACGAANPIGLGLAFAPHGEGVRTAFTPLSWHQGYDGLVHGGIIAVLLDEAMAHALIARGLYGVTARLNVRFRAPWPVGTPAFAAGRLARLRGRIAETEGSVEMDGGLVVADAEAVFVLQGEGEKD
ncbi:MAG: PaaI family thioesterase [Patescibacteria group bacterium]